MTDTEFVPRKRDREPADRPPLVDAQLADELLARAQSEGIELLVDQVQLLGLVSQLGWGDESGLAHPQVVRGDHPVEGSSPYGAERMRIRSGVVSAAAARLQATW
jgi:hypothetical protein